MAKRFTDTDLEDKLWFVELPPRLKCLVRYVQNKCDQVGVWDPNFINASRNIGEPVTEEELLEIDNGQQFIMLETGKIFIPDFVSFQYGFVLKDSCKPHVYYINLLKKHNLYHRVIKGYNKGIHTLKEKDTDQEIETEKEKDFGKSENLLPAYPEKKIPEDLDWQFEKAKFLADTLWQENYIRINGGTEWALKTRIEEFMKGIESAEDFKTAHDLKGHFTNWDRKKSKPGEVKTNGAVYIPPPKPEPPPENISQAIVLEKNRRARMELKNEIESDVVLFSENESCRLKIPSVKFDILLQEKIVVITPEQKSEYLNQARSQRINELTGTHDPTKLMILHHYKDDKTPLSEESLLNSMAKEIAYRIYLQKRVEENSEKLYSTQPAPENIV